MDGNPPRSKGSACWAGPQDSSTQAHGRVHSLELGSLGLSTKDKGRTRDTRSELQAWPRLPSLHFFSHDLELTLPAPPVHVFQRAPRDQMLREGPWQTQIPSFSLFVTKRGPQVLSVPGLVWGCWTQTGSDPTRCSDCRQSRETLLKPGNLRAGWIAVVLQSVGRNLAAPRDAFTHMFHEREKNSSFPD